MQTYKPDESREFRTWEMSHSQKPHLSKGWCMFELFLGAYAQRLLYAQDAETLGIIRSGLDPTRLADPRKLLTEAHFSHILFRSDRDQSEVARGCGACVTVSARDGARARSRSRIRSSTTTRWHGATARTQATVRTTPSHASNKV